MLTITIIENGRPLDEQAPIILEGAGLETDALFVIQRMMKAAEHDRRAICAFVRGLADG